MPIRFEPLELPGTDVFGIRVHGAFGRGDRQKLLDLAKKCLEREKLRLLLDCSDLDSLGGRGAGVLADLQKDLTGRGGEVVFVGVGPVMQRFLAQKFGDLPLRCLDSLNEARVVFGSAVGASGGSSAKKHAGGEAALDDLLDDYEVDDANLSSDKERRTADLVTAVYVSLDDVLSAVAEGGNHAAFGEALGVMLDAHDLAGETICCLAEGEHFVSPDGAWRVPQRGGIAETLLEIRRPLTMLDIENGRLWDEESQLLEDLRPDLLMPLLRHEDLAGVVFLKRAGDDHDYLLPEVFALEMLQRLMDQVPDAEDVAAADAAAREAAATVSRDRETLLAVKLELARGLQDAQDLPHFWQVFISRLRAAAEVTSLLFVDPGASGLPAFAAGAARRSDQPVDLSGERIETFFRTLERPVEIENMPASFAAVRDELLERELGWLAVLRQEEQTLGVVALGLDWHGPPNEPGEEIHELVEITAEALLRLRDGQQRANMSLGLLESLLVGEAETEAHAVTQETARAVRLLARELGLPPDQERDLVLGALVRNVGQDQNDVDDLASDQLTGEVWEAFRAHPDVGDQRMAELDAPSAVRDAVRHHHERFDGRGFPLGMSGRDIPLVARLVAIAQHFALVMHRDDADQAVAALQQEAGRSLDPDLVEIFVKALSREPARSSLLTSLAS
ncbi:HD domain-containing protein [bacterium]|nr:HD domain-containing protein [bacterium]